MTTMAVSTFRFEELPVEMRVKIMSYLDIRDKLRWMQASKSIRLLCQDESIWQNINLSWKIGVPYSFINFVLEKNCISLILRGTKMIGRALQLTKMCPLRFLDLGHCDINERSMNELLFSCQSLEKIKFGIIDIWSSNSQKYDLHSKWTNTEDIGPRNMGSFHIHI